MCLDVRKGGGSGGKTLLAICSCRRQDTTTHLNAYSSVWYHVRRVSSWRARSTLLWLAAWPERGGGWGGFLLRITRRPHPPSARAGAGAGAGADAKKLATTFLVSGHIFIVPRDILTPMSAPANAAMDAEAEGIGSAPIHLPFMSALAVRAGVCSVGGRCVVLAASPALCSHAHDVPLPLAQFAQSMEFLKLLKAHLDATGGPWVSLPKVEQGIESESLDVILKDRPECVDGGGAEVHGVPLSIR